MTSPNAWGTLEPKKEMETMNFAEIMSEEYAQHLQDREYKRHEEQLCKQKQHGGKKVLKQEVSSIWGDNQPSGSKQVGTVDGISYADASAAYEPTQREDEEWEDYSALLCNPAAVENDAAGCDSDEVIAQMLQSQYDSEYNEQLKRIEKQRNKNSKVTVTLDNFRRGDDTLSYEDEDTEDEEDEEQRQKRDWDRFETNEKIFETIPKCGFKMDKEGEMITKHDENLCGVRNACRVMSFPPEFPTGDGAGFDMKLSNQVYNKLKTYSRRGVTNGSSGKKNKMNDRKVNVATAEMGVDEPTRVLLYKLTTNQILEQINGIVSTGKEAVILHANSDPAYTGSNANGQIFGGISVPPERLPKECAIKIFKTTLNEFKQRDRYIKDDHRFKDRFSKQNSRVVINMWAEKEMHNIKRMQRVGINCPDVIILKKHVLVMSFIGDNYNAAPKLKDAELSASELSSAYKEIVDAMHKLYNEAKLVHADLSEYNILWHDKKCWFIDVAQSVVPEHPSALEFLMRDCGNIISFFKRRKLANIFTKEQLFEHITGLNAETHNAAMLERIHTRGANIAEATAPNQEYCPDELKPLEYPFELAWEKSQSDKQRKSKNTIDQATNAVQMLTQESSVEVVASQEQNNQEQSNILNELSTNTTAKQ